MLLRGSGFRKKNTRKYFLQAFHRLRHFSPPKILPRSPGPKNTCGKLFIACKILLREKSCPVAPDQKILPANFSSLAKFCVHLTHLYDLRTIDLTEWPDFFDDMRTDIEVECGRFGKVVDVLVDTTHQTGSVCVVYSNTFDAECCAHHMNGRWFVGQNITALISTRPNLSLPAPTLQQPAVSSATC